MRVERAACMMFALAISCAQDHELGPKLDMSSHMDPKYGTPEEGRIHEIFKGTYEDNKQDFDDEMWTEAQAALFPPGKGIPKPIDLDKHTGNTKAFARMAMKAALNHGKKKGLADLKVVQSEYDGLYKAVTDV